MPDRLYCTIEDLINDLRLNGADPSEDSLMSRIRTASDFIDRRLGWFIPTTDTRRFDGSGTSHLVVDPPVLSITSITVDGTAIASSQYVLFPQNRAWPNGPYYRLTVDPDATQLSVWRAERDVIEMIAQFGKYDETMSTGATVQNATQLAAGETALLVDDGSKLSPGMVLLIESEQALVTATGSPTDSTANTTEAIALSDDLFDVDNGALVNAGETIRVELEQMRVRAVVSNTLYVARGWNGTQKVAHTTGKDVYAYRTFTIKRGVNGTTDATHLNGVGISRQLPPYDVNWLCRQMAGLAKKKAESGFVGKVGNAELGETFYTNEFPKEQINEVARNYRFVRL